MERPFDVVQIKKNIKLKLFGKSLLIHPRVRDAGDEFSSN